MVYAQEEARAKLLEIFVIGGAILSVFVVVVGGVWLIGLDRGLW
jgi:hypothetical protein